jgi:L-alanine-DL-glutamate epimerase-like enolase superfamily enzyme
VNVETDAGITRIGEGGTRDMLEQCAGTVIGKDPFRSEALWQEMYMTWFYAPGREKIHALGALDMALWDVKGKALQIPLRQMLGGAARDYSGIASMSQVKRRFCKYSRNPSSKSRWPSLPVRLAK